MFDIGGGEMLFFMVVTWAAMAFALYWIMRLAVKHGIEDSRRYPPADLRATDHEQR